MLQQWIINTILLIYTFNIYIVLNWYYFRRGIITCTLWGIRKKLFVVTWPYNKIQQNNILKEHQLKQEECNNTSFK